MRLPSLSVDQPLLLYELNEVPWRIFDWYVERRPQSAMARLLSISKTFTTYTHDEGELHPWTTWPTLHRGVSNRVHDIRFINQNRLEADNSYPPLWSILRRCGVRVGVFGSLQSYPPNCDGGYEFYVPDTFAPSSVTSPMRYSAFQRFNLRQTRQDGAQAKDVKLGFGVIRDLLAMMCSGLRMRTLATLCVHLVNERFNSLYRSRRSVLQALVAFDFFRDALKRSNPQFCTFFTNHVAGMMHRYWRYAFPEDFGSALACSSDFFYNDNIMYAMDIADNQIEMLMSYVSSRRGCLMVASSMGQEAINHGEYFGEWRIEDVTRFLLAIEWSAPAENLLAMQPDFNLAFPTEHDAKHFISVAAKLIDSDGKSIWGRVQRIENTVNLGLSPSREAIASGFVFFERPNGNKQRLSIDDLGIKILRRHPGSGYHQPHGILLVCGNGIKPCNGRDQIDSTEIKPAILSMFGIVE